jgi:hypothetical protein
MRRGQVDFALKNIRGRKKLKNWLNRENKKKKTEKKNREKKSSKPIKIFKKPIGSVWFRFYKPRTEKAKPNPNRKKQEKTEPNRVEPVFVQKNELKK